MLYRRRSRDRLAAAVVVTVAPIRNWMMVAQAAVLHVSWAVLLLLSPTPLFVTSVHSLGGIGRFPLAVVLMAAGVSAFAGLAWDRRTAGEGRLRVGVLLMLPQQAVLLLSAFGALQAMTRSQFADGVTRPTAFIVADQLYTVLLAAGHTAAVISTQSDPKGA